MSKQINSREEFEVEILNHKGYSLIDFWATWCGPCRMMAPVLDSAEEVLGDKINFTKCDVDKNETIARDFEIMSIPTIVVFKDGKEVTRLIGAVNAEEFVKQLNEIIGA